MEPTKRQREIISRCAAGVLGGLLCFGAYHCIRVTFAMLQEQNSYGSVPWLLGGVGVALGLLGAAAALYAVMPSSVFQRLMGPPKDTTLWEGRDSGTESSIWWWLFWWW